jgi:O-methyltransferase
LVEERGLSGAVVECGVLDGGAAALMAYATSRSDRPIHLFDAWQGLPPATNKDGPDADKWIGQVVGSPTRVRRVMKKLKVNPARLNFHVGWFDETFGPASERIDRVAVLHIDPDFYEPVKLCLATWFPKVEPGGFVQFDDYGEFEGATRAIDEFLGNNPELKLETYGQGGAAYFIEKPR